MTKNDAQDYLDQIGEAASKLIGLLSPIRDSHKILSFSLDIDIPEGCYKLTQTEDEILITPRDYS